jgi:glycosyltransferase involved in cell wall biosynthesis
MSDLSVSWFALGHATATVGISRLLGKPSVIVLGGWDVAAMPEIPYGAMLSASRRRKTKWTLRSADLVLAVSEANQREAQRWVDRDFPVVPLGVDTEAFSPAGAKEPWVVTVASVTHEAVVRTKGLDILFAVARNLPATRFVVVGGHVPEWDIRLRRMAPSNVEMTGWLDKAELRLLFRRARVYAQLSAHESFGLALAEAMACGCVPVVSDRGSLPEVVGPVGTVVPYGDVAATTAAVAKACSDNDGTEARRRIVRTFPISLRKQRLLAALEALF